ncbi:unnamed protein product [Mortierella alpina]
MTASTTQTFTREEAICMGPYTVSTDPALYLSAVELSNVPEMVRLLNINKDVYNGSAIFQYPYLESHAQERIQRAHEDITTLGINTHWAMRTTPTGPMIGWAHCISITTTTGILSPCTRSRRNHSRLPRLGTG